MVSACDAFPVRLLGRITHPVPQVIGMLIVSLVAVLIAYRPCTRLVGTEKEILLTPMTPGMVKEWAGVPIRVSVGLYITNFPTFDFVNSDFTFDGGLWFGFDPALISLSTVGNFSFEKGEIIHQSKPSVQVVDGRFFAHYTVRVRFKSDMDYAFFPFDAHRIDLVLVNNKAVPSEMIFRSYSPFFELSPALSKRIGWLLLGTSIRTGWREIVIDEYETKRNISRPCAVFSMRMRRIGFRNAMLILLPLFMIYFLSLFSLALDPRRYPTIVFGLASAGVTALLGYRFVIEGMSPKVGYFVLSDKVFIFFLTATLIIFSLAIFLIRLAELKPFIIVLKGLVYTFLHVGFLCSWYYFLHNV